MAQNDQKWPQKGQRRHLGPRDPPILTPRPILPQLEGVRPIWRPKRVKKGPKGPTMAQNYQKWPPKGVETPLGPSVPSKIDSQPHFTPTLGGPDPLGALAPLRGWTSRLGVPPRGPCAAGTWARGSPMGPSAQRRRPDLPPIGAARGGRALARPPSAAPGRRPGGQAREVF